MKTTSTNRKSRVSIMAIGLLFTLLTCQAPTQEQQSTGKAEGSSQPENEMDPQSQPLKEKENQDNYRLKDDGIPVDGTYVFDIAFAEWGGISMGEEVTVVISGNRVQVIYEGNGSLTNTKAGEIMESGNIMKHHSGVWIITETPSDTTLQEIGGCVDGPSVIDFEGRKFWMC